MKGVAAIFYDGRSAQRRSAELLLLGDEVVVRGDFGERRARRRDVDIAEPMGGAPRQVRFADGSVLEVADLAGFASALQAAGMSESPVVRLQSRWTWALAALAATLALLAALYAWGLPALGKALAPRIPAPLVQSLSTHTLAFLDQKLLAPSRLPEARRAALAAAANELLSPLPEHPAYRLHFRSAAVGPNAFALPNGDIVVFDQLVDLAGSDAEVAGVIAHELGHVAYRHGVRQMIQSTVVSFVVGLFLGDVSSIATGLGALLLESRYSRAFELEADAYAAQAMRAAGRSTEPLATMLERLEKARAGKGGGPGWDGLSSHPDTAERISRLRATRLGNGN